MDVLTIEKSRISYSIFHAYFNIETLVTMDPIITWILPVKNGMPFLPETLRSLTEQTENRTFVIAWDNGSTDGTIKTLREWIPSQLPGQVVADRPSQFLSQSLRDAVELAQTPYCARIDADDICHPERLAIQIEWLEKHPEVALIGSQVEFIDENGKRISETNDLAESFSDIIDDFLFRCPICHPTWLFRRDEIIAAGNYRNLGFHKFQDNELLMRLVVNGHRIQNLPEPLIRYRVHRNSITQQTRNSSEAQSNRNKLMVQYAQSLFGIEPSRLGVLLDNESSLSISDAWGIARGLSRFDSLQPTKRLRSPRFQRGLGSLLDQDDHLRQFVMAAIRADWPVARNRLRRSFTG